jgi:hypothetical protein
MYRKLFYLVSFVLVLSVALTSVSRAADPDLVGWWRFDDGSGTTAADFSGNGNDGTLQGDTAWVTGHLGKALEFDGVDDFVDVPHSESLMVGDEVTVMAWINTPRHLGPGGELWQGILSKSNDPRSYSFYTDSSGVLHFSVTSGGAYVGPVSTGQVPLNEWFVRWSSTASNNFTSTVKIPVEAVQELSWVQKIRRMWLLAGLRRGQLEAFSE